MTYVATSNSYSELTEDGDLYIACTGSVTKVNIEESFETDVAVKMAVPFVDADGLRIWPDSDGGFTIPSNTHKLTVSGFVINYAPLNLKVSYCLKGFDTASVTVNRSELKPVDYTNLRGGEYCFVMRLEGEGTNGSSELSVLIRKELAIYEQVWFWIIVGMAVLLLDLWLIRLMLKQQARRIERKKDQERIAEELRLASVIQVSSLPRAFPQAEEGKKFDLYASMTPAKEVGGDFYDFFLIDSNHLALVIADVSGKGIPAALFMMSAKNLIDYRSPMGGGPSQILCDVNKQLCRDDESGMFVTVWMGILDLRTGAMTCANAGHEFPMIRAGDGVFRKFTDRHGLPLGVMPGAKYQDYVIQMQSGDAVFVYTDGVPEANNAAGELYTLARLELALNQIQGRDPRSVLEGVRSDVDAFVLGAAQFDDLTMLCVTYHGGDDQAEDA
ncbi:MAG: PP2C family protein-serine/threonine phosphatase [Clostridia bacterium]|nr:PP2C family protein-serine/threonine phosphatase [Clostridia bacterium]